MLQLFRIFERGALLIIQIEISNLLHEYKICRFPFHGKIPCPKNRYFWKDLLCHVLCVFVCLSFLKKVFCKQLYLLNQPGGTEKLRFWPGLWMVMLATMSSDSKCLCWGMEIFLPSTSLLLQLSYLDSKQDISAVNLIILLLKNSEIGMSEHYFTDQ